MKSTSDLLYLANHVFLPPKLPQYDDSGTERDIMLTQELELALRSYEAYNNSVKMHSTWQACTTMASNMLGMRDPSGKLIISEIEKSLKNMSDGDIRAFHIRGQNAGLIIRGLSNNISFEIFEVSPMNVSVMENKGRLRRTFPGPSISISYDIIGDASCCAAIVDLVAKLDLHTPDESWPEVTKAKSKTIETRDTIHPQFATEMLSSILLSVGEGYDALRISKSTREEVLWDNALQPWHRSSLWLLLRVVLQTTLNATESDTSSGYKSFMIFFMARILQDALSADLPDDILFVMAAKIGRRVLKLGTLDRLVGLEFVGSVIENVHQRLNQKWISMQRNPDPFGHQHSWNFLDTTLGKDFQLSAMTLRPYLEMVRESIAPSTTSEEFMPICAIRLGQSHSDLPRFCTQIDTYEQRLSLMDLELWVENHLSQWLERNKSNLNACTALATLMSEYACAARTLYGNQPEETSLMLLTLMSLWVALDTCALQQHALLAEYSPGFRADLLDALILPNKLQLERLACIEDYLNMRSNTATLSSSFIFTQTAQSKSLAVRFYEQSHSHQVLHERIEREATEARERKLQELVRQRAKRDELIQEYESLEHENVNQWNGDKCFSSHKSSCRKCSLERTAANMEITVHEWPLPYNKLEAKSTVFELDVPVAISEWRNATYKLLADMLSPRLGERSSSEKIYYLRTFKGLSSYWKSQDGRFQLASKAKSFTVAHYASKKVSSALKEDICVNNGLKYEYWDSNSNHRTTQLLGKCSIREICTFQIPAGNYDSLQYAVANTTHTSNEVLSLQAVCPVNLNLHEFYAFATLRSGCRLQWRNIARAIADRVLDFSKYEVHILLLQAAWQAGPVGDSVPYRDSHIDLAEENFGIDLLARLECAIAAVEGNWQNASALRTFNAVIVRLCSVSPHLTVHMQCYSLMRRIRKIALEWTRDIKLMYLECQDSEATRELGLRVLEMALTCHNTFVVDQRHSPRILNSAADLAVAIESCISIHDHSPSGIGSLSGELQMMLLHFQRASHLLEGHQRRMISENNEGINVALLEVWQGYRPGSSWSTCPYPNERWLVTDSACGSGMTSRRVHYNLITGSLLVDGCSLSRLPSSYELDQTYVRVFGQKVFDVMPSTMEGMKYEARNLIHGHRVHFRMDNSTLIIRTQALEKTFEIIPISALEEDFPAAFLNDYIHWMDITTGQVEWRPLGTAWSSSPSNWHLRKTERETYVLQKGSDFAIDIRSDIAKCISRLMSPLETATNIHISFNVDKQELKICLPRFKLDFTVKERRGSIESKQFRSMVIDENQAFGAFTGLVNKLVLRDIKSPNRIVLVPHGDLSFIRMNNHVKVVIDTSEEMQIKYHAYRIDVQLQRIVDNGSLLSRLFRLYLHATTSNCLVDELTGRTGTEEALYGLAGAATTSFTSLGPAETTLLGKIAQLSPDYQFYPQHLRVMQQITWCSLPPLSQHGSFYQLVSSILDHAKRLEVFGEGSANRHFPDIENRNNFLLEKAMIRNASFHVSQFGAESYSTRHDRVYQSRDTLAEKARPQHTYTIAKLVNSWSANIKGCETFYAAIESWQKPINGVVEDNSLELGFHPKWLQPWREFMPQYWCQICNALIQSEEAVDKYRILIFLSMLSYSTHTQQNIVQTLVAFATNPVIRALSIPNEPILKLQDGYEPSLNQLIYLAEKNLRNFTDSPESREPKLPGESKADAKARRRRTYNTEKDLKIRSFAQKLMEQWPTAGVESPRDEEYSQYISVDGALEDVNGFFRSCQRNLEFKGYNARVAKILMMQSPEPIVTIPLLMWQELPYHDKRVYLSFADLTAVPAPLLPARAKSAFDSRIGVGPSHDDGRDYSELNELLKRFDQQCTSKHERHYANDLWASFEALRQTSVTPAICLNLKSELDEYLDQQKSHVASVSQLICRQLQASVPNIVQRACMLPRICPNSILSLLASRNITSLTAGWRSCIVQYGCALTSLQRAQRLIAALSNPLALSSELENVGHLNWEPADHPEWLLLEIENNILIRPEQVQTSQEMICPSSGANSVMQLNMGLGKSSVITPMVAAELADMTKLARVVVLKPLALQMFSLLVAKLGGMLNRRIWYMPISRSLQLNAAQAGQIREMYEECMQSGGILLVQPEHMLSFELLGHERVLSEDPEVGNILMQTENWLWHNSRDILDESDEILSVRFELIYTIGKQRNIDFCPHRWEIIQDVLQLVGRVASEMVKQYPKDLEVIAGTPGSFPKVRILNSLVGEELLRTVARQVCERGIRGVPVWSLLPRERAALLEYLMKPEVDTTTALNGDAGPVSRRSALLLLKGLFARGILRFALEQKRWRVNYGLDSSRTLLAVPYSAKDSPTARSEFSHPDAAIVLTCLSYYYGGISDHQLQCSFDNLLQSDHASEEFVQWVRDAPALAPAFRQIDGINIKHSRQCTRDVFPSLRFAPAAINYYLKTIVFPAEMKEFPHKLSSSGWDIAREKCHPTTGFSGTNDSRYILPLSMNQRDLPPQLPTNAAVLECLLRPENSFITTGNTSVDGTLSAQALIQIAVEANPPYHVILDVGAQVIELQNEEVARIWLRKSSITNIQAAIFFDQQNELCVLTRDGEKESLLISPFLKQMDKCLVYLDEAHTRGTDLQMPENYRAIVTLGPGLTKDRLVQAAMRMRKLGKGQSVAFCGSREVQQKIRDCTARKQGDIRVADLLLWCFINTCAQTRRSIPLWRTQGVRHQRRHAAYSKLLSVPEFMQLDFIRTILEPEAQNLEQRYGNRLSEEPPTADGEAFAGREVQLENIQARYQEFGVFQFDSTLQEEQERELSPENEKEQQVERPRACKPYKHSLHEDVRRLVETGILNRLSNAVEPAFQMFQRTTASCHFEFAAWPTELLVTTDFSRTIQTTGGESLDDFLRPVHWILSCRSDFEVALLVISPFEAQELLPSIRRLQKVNLHIYSPRVSLSLLTLEDLSFCSMSGLQNTIQTSCIRDLNLFAGQLYLRNFEEYAALCEFLGICSKAPDDGRRVTSDGFVSPADRLDWGSICKFKASPMDFLRRIIAIRRKGQTFAVSHLGAILNGDLLAAEAFIQ